MVADQASQSRARSSPSRPEREIALVVRIETAGEPGVDVDTVLLYDPLPPAWADPIARHL